MKEYIKTGRKMSKEEILSHFDKEELYEDIAKRDGISVSKVQKDKIAEAKIKLNLPQYAELPRCEARANVKGRTLDEQLRADGKLGTDEEFHMKNGHVCEECRCGKRKGQGTDHLGFGWCRDHEHTSGRRANKDKVVLREKQVIQNGDFQYTSSKKYLKKIQDLSENSKDNLNLYAEIDLIRSQIQELLTEFGKIEDKKHAAQLQLNKLIMIFDGMEVLEPEQGSEVIKAVASLQNSITGITNKRGEVMDDETRITLIDRLVGKFVKVTESQFKIMDTKSILVDTFNKWMMQFINVAKRFIVKENDFEEFILSIEKIARPVSK